MKRAKRKPDIPAHLLWEYDYEKFNFDKSYKLVIERVMQLGNLHQWREVINHYTREQILDSIDWSAQLDERDKKFCRFFLSSDLVNVA